MSSSEFTCRPQKFGHNKILHTPASKINGLNGVFISFRQVNTANKQTTFFQNENWFDHLNKEIY